MKPEYDFSKMKGARGKYSKAYREGHTVIIHKQNDAIRKYKVPKKIILNEACQNILIKFKLLLSKRFSLYKMILFGSTARGDNTTYSDIDVVVITKKSLNEKELDSISDCAWEVGFGNGAVIVPVVFSKKEWEKGPERYSLLVQVVNREGVVI